MHECPDCGQTCDCDGEDVWNDWAGRTCRHACDEEDADLYLTDAAWSAEDKYARIGRFESRTEDGRRFWWGYEDGWKDETEIGKDGVLTIDAAEFAIGTILTLSEPMSNDTTSHDEAENDDLRQACKTLIEAADSGEWHNSEDCRDEGCADKCHLCQALVKARLILATPAPEEPMNPLAEKLGISIEKAGVWRITPEGLERVEEQPVIRCEAIKPRWVGRTRRKWRPRRKRGGTT